MIPPLLALYFFFLLARSSLFLLVFYIQKLHLFEQAELIKSFFPCLFCKPFWNYILLKILIFRGVSLLRILLGMDGFHFVENFTHSRFLHLSRINTY
jgi:hypothetical protein